jgi:hypothetical protein
MSEYISSKYDIRDAELVTIIQNYEPDCVVNVDKMGCQYYVNIR